MVIRETESISRNWTHISCTCTETCDNRKLADPLESSYICLDYFIKYLNQTNYSEFMHLIPARGY